MWTKLISRYDAAIWIRIIGTVITTVAGFMIRPFLVLYLYDKLEGSILLPMLVVGLQPLAAMVVGLWAGGLSDRIGRKPLMISALALNMGAMVGFFFSESVWAFALCSIVNGIGSSLFFPAANAQVADIVPAERRAEVFASLHAALNVGAAFGPMLGLLIFSWEPKIVFAISAASFALYLLLVWRKVPETMPARGREADNGGAPEAAAVHTRLNFRDHKWLFYMTLLALPIGILYAQVETVLPLHLQGQFDNYKAMLTTMLTINGLTVMLLQIPLARWTERWETRRVILLSYGLFTAVALGYGFAPGLALLILAELVFSAGEMLNGPHMQKAVSMIAPEHMRGRYFSVFSMNWQLARGVGPIAFGFLFQLWGGHVTFAIVAGSLALAGLAQYALIRKMSAAPSAGAKASKTAGKTAAAGSA
ncbi:MDR family MFS transporter [Paenibacillus thermotolerans]|uniref:MDR family MFS transporter n=1 Tax=Paenibacillus thermotolerans TaxID=3027807 RepID=UPI002368218A|nr:MULTISPECIES: MFS transporter [unclassified Paenibacillus]